MSNQILRLLRTRRNELGAITPAYGAWSSITEWHARARPLIAEHFTGQLDVFDTRIKVVWKRFPKEVAIGMGGYYSGSDVGGRQARDRQAQAAHAKLLAHIDALIELHGIDSGKSETQESDSVFADIDRLVASSLLPRHFKKVVCSDLTDAQRAYRAGSYKGCVVMLGAALEGIMLGTLQRSDVLGFLATTSTVPGPIRSLGARSPALCQKIGDGLSFEDYKVCIHELVPGSNSLGVDDIQAFRNAIHPWKSIQDPLKYSGFDRPRALHYVGSLCKIVEALYQWVP